MPRAITLTGVALLSLAAACASRAPLDPGGAAGQIRDRTGAAAR